MCILTCRKHFFFVFLWRWIGTLSRESTLIIIFSSPVWMYRKSYCTTPVIGIVSGGVDKRLKFYVKVFIWWARHCRASYPVCGEVMLALLYKCAGRAFALPPALAAVTALAQCWSFYLQFFMWWARRCQVSCIWTGLVTSLLKSCQLLKERICFSRKGYIAERNNQEVTKVISYCYGGELI